MRLPALVSSPAENLAVELIRIAQFRIATILRRLGCSGTLTLAGSGTYRRKISRGLAQKRQHIFLPGAGRASPPLPGRPL